jgi:hypothetical protein
VQPRWASTEHVRLAAAGSHPRRRDTGHHANKCGDKRSCICAGHTDIAAATDTCAHSGGCS